MIVEIIELIWIPLVILVAFGIAEQFFERIPDEWLFIKMAWHAQIFAIGAQTGFLFRQAIQAAPTNKVLYAGLYLFIILLTTVALGTIRFRLQRQLERDPYFLPSSDHIFHALWLTTVANCLPIEYLVVLDMSEGH